MIKSLLYMILFFILPAYILYVLGEYQLTMLNDPLFDYDEEFATDSKIYAAIWLLVGAIVFKCSITNYDHLDFDVDIEHSDGSSEDTNIKELPKFLQCQIVFYDWIDKLIEKSKFFGIMILILILIGLAYLATSMYKTVLSIF
ncbi:MAG: hypothetical protein U9N59_03745 [Campylobacterota bacterium]|nr:hypothetical protein [Campylobacterota bacterium]